jgi:hypothetical protein
MPWQKPGILRQTEKRFDMESAEQDAYEQELRSKQESRLTTEKVDDSRVQTKVQKLPPRDPSESTVHGKEVHTAVHKQTQKEVFSHQLLFIMHSIFYYYCIF